MYSKCGDVKKSLEGRAAIDFFSRMQETTVKPNSVTFNNVLCPCSHAGLVKKAQPSISFLAGAKLTSRIYFVPYHKTSYFSRELVNCLIAFFQLALKLFKDYNLFYYLVLMAHERIKRGTAAKANVLGLVLLIDESAISSA
ncbi:hypothetical protein COLO4_00455 [Corchorus olitorius]|uniref:Pentatricopeptide repeat-containing protein n=1 Tax=Corchorus olitorius TaxID=93759 RepID=A0A1R3L3T2_9ROSI|nr:hypothetical protein COLO4_00455 [Corchorus olitorius]